MSKFHSYLNTAYSIVKSYNGDLPLSVYLKSFFSANKKYGSKDRKQITNICYSYYRLGKAIPNSSANSEIRKHYFLAGLLVCTDKDDQVLEAVAPEWNNIIQLPLEEKFFFLRGTGIDIDIGAVFPWPELLSNGINYHQFCRSFFVQPDLFLRIRPGHKPTVVKKLDSAAISFSTKDKDTLVLPNITKIPEVVRQDEEVVVQDYSSQRIAEFLKLPAESYNHGIKVWDCCAASGGKSILAADVFKNIELTVSDVRASILKNLQIRFRRAGIKKYKSFVADLTQPKIPADAGGYDLIICDAPCSGSGTWSRTPEQLYFWNENDIDYYINLQQKISSNILSFIKPGGYLLYITCSVFKRENEDIVKKIVENSNLELVQMNVIKGYDEKADTMFGALMRKGKGLV